MITHLPSDLEIKLLEEKLSNPNMLGFFKHYKPEKIVRINESFMSCGMSDELWWYIHSKSSNDFKEFLNQLGTGEHFFGIINDWMLALVREQFEVEWALSCIRLYMPYNTNLPKSVLKVSDLTSADSIYIFENSNYKAFTSPEYINQQLKLRPGVACRIGGKLVGWAMFHDDGALGLLHVLNDYRRQGIARGLVLELCHRLQDQNQLPYTSVEPTNIASLSMVKSLGFVELDNIHWVKAKL